MSFIADYPLTSLSSALIAFLVARKIAQSVSSPLRRLAGPSGAHWFWGHELTAFERPSGDAYTEWIDAYGQTYKIKGAMFHPDILVTVDAGAIAHMFSKEVYSYEKSDAIRTLLDRVAGKGLPYVTGDTHKRQRYQLSPFFTTQATREMYSVIGACAQAVADRLTTKINSGTTVVNIPEWTGRATLDVIGRFAFDYDFECGESEAAKTIQRSWKEQCDLTMQRAGFIGILVLRACPWIVDLPIKAIQQEGAVKVAVRNLARKVIERGPSETKQRNLLSTLVGLAAKGELDASSDELLDHASSLRSRIMAISTLILVGHETTAGSLTWTLYELAKKPEYQTRLREEIMSLGREPTYDDLMSGMPFLDAVMKERHRPGSSHTERVALKDDVLRLRNPVYNDRGHKVTEVPIKAGQLIHIPSISLTHLKSVWGSDAEEYRPERWLDPARIPSPSETCAGWNGLFIFSEGARSCIGYRLAILEFKVILSTYIRHFEFHDTGAMIKFRFANTLQPYVVGEEAKGGQLPLRVSLVDAQK
ncbi:hypothetical protein FRC07_008698 [Ceratobasidium sp. 392]|nr:hypothetical protein FRC07_008698 [Ceratobasidium sp. 392]